MPTAGISEKSKAEQTQASSAQGASIEDILKFSGIPIRDEEMQREWQEDGLDFNQNQPILTGSLTRIITGGNKE